MRFVQKVQSHQERRTIAEHFCYGNTLPLLTKQKKLNSAFFLHFCLVEAHTKLRGVRQI